MSNPKFPIGRIVTTPAALSEIASHDMFAALFRHVTGDWGDVSADDRKENDMSLEKGFRLVSAYHAGNRVKFLIITEADRSVTTVLLPSDY